MTTYFEFQISLHGNSLFFLPTTSPTLIFLSSQCRLLSNFFIHVVHTHSPLCLLISSLCLDRFSLIFVGVLTPPPPFSSYSSLCVLSSVFVHVRHTHTPFASSSPGSADHWPTSICISVRTFILPHFGSLYSHPPFLPCLLSAFIVLMPSFASSPESLWFIPPWYMFIILTTPLALLVSR